MPVRDLSADMAALAGCWCATMLYGVNVVLYIGCMYVLIYKRRGSLNWILIATSTVQYLLATVHVATIFRALIEGFVFNGRTDSIMPYWLNMAVPIHIAQESIYIINSVIGDAVLVWRLWVVWPSQRWICIPPMIGVFATLVCGAATEFELSHLSPTESPFIKIITAWLVATWSLSIAVQTTVTALISYRIWSTSYHLWACNGPSTQSGSSRHMKIVWILLESGWLYCTSTIVLLVLFMLKTQAGAIVGNSMGQISSLVPALIIVRVGLGLTHVPPSAPRRTQVSTISFGRPFKTSSDDMQVIEVSHSATLTSMGSPPSAKTQFSYDDTLLNENVLSIHAPRQV